MYIQDYSGAPEDVLAAAFSTPKLHPKKKPTREVVMRVVHDTVRKRFLAKLGSEIFDTLEDVVLEYEMLNDRPADEDTNPDAQRRRDEYEEGLDDAIEAALEPYNEYLSANWLGEKTIDTGVWEDEHENRKVLTSLCTSAAKEIFKTLTGDKTPNQMLANAGITQEAVDEALQNSKKESNAMTADPSDVQAVYQKMHEHLGTEFDQMLVFDDIGVTLIEDDEILSNAAAQRLGLTEDEADVLRTEALVKSAEDVADEAVMFLSDKSSFKSSRKSKPAAKPEGADEAALDPVVFENLKVCGAKDTDMADALGVSRSTYTNYTKGKTAMAPDADQYKVLRTEVIDRANRMLAALSALDGTDRGQVE